MMRDLKFRAWDKASEQMYYPLRDSYLPQITYCDFHWLIADVTGGSVEPEDYVVMQFTGLKDSEGVEIYEGDVLEGSIKGRRKVVEFYQSEHASKFVAARGDGITDIGTLTAESFTVIGNIHENSELLETE